MGRLPPTRQLIASFAQGFSGERFCANCLSARIGADVYAVREAITALTGDGDGFSVESRRCSACGRRARTLGYDAALAGNGSPHCRMCSNPIADDTNPVFPADGGVVHEACFREAQERRRLEGGSDLGCFGASAGPWTGIFERRHAEILPTAARYAQMRAWNPAVIRIARNTRDRSSAVRRVSRVLYATAAQLRNSSRTLASYFPRGGGGTISASGT